MQIVTPTSKINQTSKHISQYWGELINSADNSHKALRIPNPYITPSKKFDAFFYWDTYFTNLGLVIDDRYGLAEGAVKNFLFEINELGFIPNFNGSSIGVSKTRSQPPFLSQMFLELFSVSGDKELLRECIEPLKREYEYWTSPPKLFKLGLSRYYDSSFFSKLQPYSTMAESGWDFTNRFKNIKQSLPVDLNTLLFLYEKDIIYFFEILGILTDEEKEKWENRYKQRIELINKYWWDEERKFFYDFSPKSNKTEKSSSLAGFFPMWGKIIDYSKAENCVEKAHKFLAPGGFVTTLDNKIDGWWIFMKPFGLQWCYPVGWAPLQWIVNKGLCNYNYDILAAESSLKFLSMIADIFVEKGDIYEKYNVINKSTKVKAPQGMHTGFGWTNSIFQTLLIRIILGIEPSLKSGFKFSPRIPALWQQHTITASFSNYPKIGLNLSLKIEEKRNDEKIIKYLMNVNKAVEIEMRFFKKTPESFQSILINNEERMNDFQLEPLGKEEKTIAISKKPISLKSGHINVIQLG